MADTWTDIARRLGEAGIENPRQEARYLILAVTGIDPVLQDPAMNDVLERSVALRCGRVPLSKIIGVKEFYGRDFGVNAHVLDPRPDSETLIRAALSVVPEDANILDLGTGSGCLLLTLLAERPMASGVGVDLSQDALDVARYNAALMSFEGRAVFVLDDLARHIPARRYDLVISNPPYIPTADIARLAPEVRDHDPRLALDGGADGCDPYRALFARMDEYLSASGYFLVEIGFDICDKVIQLAMDAGLQEIDVIEDLAGHRRVVQGRCG